ncbi:MAG: DNA primase [Luteolibacter sp.]|jgi:DNA primase
MLRPRPFQTTVQIPRESVEKVLEATDIVDLIGGYLQLQRAGAQFRCNCPFHNEKTPSFYVTPSMQRYHCFGCGAGGDAISFVREYENLPFSDAVRKLATRANIPIIEQEETADDRAKRKSRGRLLDLHREASAMMHELLLKDAGAAHARAYLKERGFGKAMAARWEIGWMPENTKLFSEWAKSKNFTGRELVDAGIAYQIEENNPRAGLRVRFRDRLMFPIRNEVGDVIGFSGRQLREDPKSGKYINSPETSVFKKSNVLFALDRAKKPILHEKSALLCEGQIDVIACHERGIEHAIAPLGTAFTTQHARLIKRYTNQVLICYDADSAGLKAAERAYRELAAAGISVRVVRMPDGDDPDTFLKNHGEAAFRKLLIDAREFFDFKLELARAAGLLEIAADRSRITDECVSLLAAMGDQVARDQQINIVANHLKSSSSALREAIAREIKRPKRKFDADAGGDAKPDRQPPTPLDHQIAALCQLALRSVAAQHALAEQFETIHEARRWLAGVPLLETILDASPDPASPAAVNAFISSLPEPDQLALASDPHAIHEAPADGRSAAEHALAMLSSTVLQLRDAAIKAELKQPGIAAERMLALLQEAKEISGLLRGIGQRHQFDDDLPASTFKPKTPEKFRKKQSS